jgi:hypothetical protein
MIFQYYTEMRLNPREMADRLFKVQWLGCSRFQNAMAKNAVIKFSDITTFYMRSGNDKSHFAPDDERYSRLSAPPRSIRHYIK